MNEIEVRQLKASLRELLRRSDKLTPAVRPLPQRTPRPLETGRSASAEVLAERDEDLVLSRGTG